MDGGSSDKSPQVFAPDVTKAEDHHVHENGDCDGDDDKTKPSSLPLSQSQQPPPKKKQKKRGGGGGPPHRREHNSIELAYQDVIIETRRQSCTDGESGVVDGDDEKKNTKVVDQHRPDSPRFFFQESYEVTIKPGSQLKLEGGGGEEEAVSSSMSQPTPLPLQQIVHHHVNSLVVVTIGDELKNNATIKNLLQQQQQQSTSSSGLEGVDRVEVEVEGVELTCKPGPSCNAGQTRKKHAKMLKKGPRPPSKCNNNNSSSTNSGNVAHDNNDGIVTPTTMIAKVTVRITTRRREQPLTQNKTTTGDNETKNENEHEHEEIEDDQQDVATVTTTIPYYACVWGTIVELNPEILVRPNLLLDDPLMDGHLAIIHPAGTFPPPSRPSRQSSSLTPPPTPPPQTESAMQ
mmetsp:Transcript_24830/g.58930  ORF Transcript_24830/g.58930 Transcript_24830/m.58930 type:complete len:403 (-) Transcript_24830:1286-2494(-)